MSITKGAMLISNANAVGTELVNQLGGTGYKPVEWADKINLLGINPVDAPYAIKSIQAGTYTGEERGAIQYSNCNAVGSMLNKKLNTNRGFKPVEWPSSINVLKPLTENTVTGDICNVSDGSEQVPLKSWSVNIPANLTGKSAVVCTQIGKNLLLNKTYQRNANTLRLGTDTLDDRLSLKASTYTLSLTSDVAIGTLVYTIGGNSTGITFTSSGTRYYGSFTLSADTDDIFLHVYKSGGITAENVSDFMLEVGSDVSTYTPYVAPTVNTVDLGRTVYGADVDVVDGSGSETYGYIVFDGSDDEVWQKHGSIASWFYIDNAITDGYVNSSESDFMICNLGTQAKYSSVAQLSNGQFAFGLPAPTTYRFVFKNTSFTEVADFKTWLSNNNMQIVYKLATPTDFTFDPITPTPETNTSVKNFWNDTGSNTITYYQAPTALTRSTVSGSIASFSDADTRLTCVNAIATIPPSIAGVDTVQLVRVGKNLLNPSDLVVGSINSSGENINSSTRVRSGYIKINGGQKYSMSIGGSVQIFEIQQYKADFTKAVNLIAVNAQSYVLTASNDTAFTRLLMRFSNNATIEVSDITELQVETGDTVTAYEAYNATTYTANLPSTNHGGSVDFVNGVGHSTHIKKTVRWGDLGNVTQLADVTRKEIVLSASEEPKYITSSASTDLLNDKNLPYDMTYSGNFEHIYIANSTRIWIYLPNGTDADTEITICYTLADALQTDFTFTGQAIIPKTGTNNCYNNVGGNTEITYFTNT